MEEAICRLRGLQGTEDPGAAAIQRLADIGLRGSTPNSTFNAQLYIVQAMDEG